MFRQEDFTPSCFHLRNWSRGLAPPHPARFLSLLVPCGLFPKGASSGPTAKKKQPQKLCLRGLCEFRIPAVLEISLLLSLWAEGKGSASYPPPPHVVVSSLKQKIRSLLRDSPLRGSPLPPRSSPNSLDHIQDPSKGSPRQLFKTSFPLIPSASPSHLPTSSLPATAKLPIFSGKESLLSFPVSSSFSLDQSLVFISVCFQVLMSGVNGLLSYPAYAQCVHVCLRDVRTLG